MKRVQVVHKNKFSCYGNDNSETCLYINILYILCISLDYYNHMNQKPINYNTERIQNKSVKNEKN